MCIRHGRGTLLAVSMIEVANTTNACGVCAVITKYRTGLIGSGGTLVGKAKGASRSGRSHPSPARSAIARQQRVALGKTPPRGHALGEWLVYPRRSDFNFFWGGAVYFEKNATTRPLSVGRNVPRFFLMRPIFIRRSTLLGEGVA